MRGIFSIVSLLVTLLLVAFLVRQQIQSTVAPPGAPASAARTQPQQVQADVERALQAGQQNFQRQINESQQP